MSRIPHERVLQFRLSRDRNLIDDGYRALILGVLFEGGITDLEEINARLIDFDISWIPTYILKKRLDELIKEGKVIFKNGKCFLAEKEKKEIEQTIETRDHVSKLLSRNVIEGIEKHYHLDNTLKDEINSIFKEIMVSFFTTSSRLIVSYLTEEQKLTFNVPDIVKIIDEKAERIQDPKLREAVKKSIKENLLKEAGPIIYEYLYDMFSLYTYFEILGLDPECKIVFNITKVYLDTNVLLDLLLPPRKGHLLATECVRISQALGIQNKYTKKTAEELVSVIREYKKAASLREDILERISKTDDGLLKGFFIEKSNNPSFTFDGYCLWLEKAYEKILKDKFNIEIDNEKYDEIEQDAKELVTLVEEAAISNLEFKHSASILHDAFNLQLVKQLQKDGSLVFFITNDYSLFHVSKILLEKDEVSKPLSISSEVWLQALMLIRPLDKEKRASSEVFKEFLIRPLTARLNVISINKLLSVAFPWLKEEYLTPEDLEDIASIKFVEEYIIKPQEEKKEARVTFEDIVPRLIDKKVEEKIKRLQEENKKLQEEYKSKLEELEKKSKAAVPQLIQPKWLFIAGLMFGLAIPIIAGISAKMELSIPDSVYWIMGLLCFGLICTSAFGEKIIGKISSVFGKKFDP